LKNLFPLEQSTSSFQLEKKNRKQGFLRYSLLSILSIPVKQVFHCPDLHNTHVRLYSGSEKAFPVDCMPSAAGISNVFILKTEQQKAKAA